jgi:glycosyltransferase involved in cell wall biosynthesis
MITENREVRPMGDGEQAQHKEEVIVVASGCTDRTVPIVAEMARQESRVRLCLQEKREGKASAMNRSMSVSSPLVQAALAAAQATKSERNL